MPEVNTLTESMNDFVRISAEKRKLELLVAPLEKRIEALEARIAKLETTKAPKGKE